MGDIVVFLDIKVFICVNVCFLAVKEKSLLIDNNNTSYKEREERSLLSNQENGHLEKLSF